MGEMFMSTYVHSRIDSNLIAGHSGHVGLCQLYTKTLCRNTYICMQRTKAYMARTSCNQAVIDSAMYVCTYMLDINSPIVVHYLLL